MKSKVCAKCKIQKQYSEFHKYKDHYASRCKLCASLDQKRYREEHINEYKEKEKRNKKRRKERLRGLIAEYIDGKGCVDCGYNEHLAPMQFDHRDRSTKIMDISNMISRTLSWDRVKTELDKCDLVCANCHAIRTSKQFNWYAIDTTRES